MLYNEFVKYPQYQFIKTEWFKALVMFVTAIVLVFVVFNPFAPKTSFFGFPAPTPTLIPEPSPIGGYPKETDQFLVKLENAIGSEWEIGKYDISPKGDTVAFSAFKNPSTLSLFIYSIKTNSARSIITNSSSRLRSQESNLDNHQVKFSPGGEYWFFNQTIYDSTQLYVLSSDGKVLYIGKDDLGHPTWLNRYQLLFIASSTGEKAAILDLYNNQVTKSDIPSNLMHLSLSPGLAHLAALERNPGGKPTQCGQSNLVVYDFVTSTLLKKIPDVNPENVKWVGASDLSYQTIISCPSTYSATTVVSF